MVPITRPQTTPNKKRDGPKQPPSFSPFFLRLEIKTNHSSHTQQGHLTSTPPHPTPTKQQPINVTYFAWNGIGFQYMAQTVF